MLLATAKYGAGLSPDSVAYLDVARNLASGKGFVFHTGEPLVWWPPLYPVLLALIGFVTRLDPTAFAHLVNAALFALVIYLSARLFRTSSWHNMTYSGLGVCAVLLSIPLCEVYAMAWSECLFVPLVLLYLVSAQRYCDSESVLSLAVMVFSTALACMTRYIGVALVPAGVVTIMLASRVNFKARFARAFVFAGLSAAPLGLWFLRNHQLTGTFAGPRGGITSSIIDNVVLSFEAMLSWYTFVMLSRFVVLALIAAMTIVVLSSRAVTRRLTSSLKGIFIDHPPVVSFLAAYIIMLPIAATRDAFVESRTLSPVYVPLTLVLLRLAHDLLRPTHLSATAFVRKVPTILLALWLCMALASVVRSTVGRFENGAGGFSRKRWRESETVAYVERMLSANHDVHVHSNGTDALWAVAGVVATELPIRSEVNLSELRGRWPNDSGSVIVWFNTLGWREQYLSVKELGEAANVESIAHFSDGSIYRVSVRDTAAPD